MEKELFRAGISFHDMAERRVTVTTNDSDHVYVARIRHSTFA